MYGLIQYIVFGPSGPVQYVGQCYLPNTSIQENSSIPLVIKTLLTAYILPVSQLTENIVYQTHITRFSAVSRAEIYSRYMQSLDYGFLGVSTQRTVRYDNILAS